MASFLIARLPDEPKSLEVIDFMTNNHISYRLSSNSVLLNVLMSSGAEDSRLAAAVGFWEGFESVKEEIHVADQFTNIFESVEVKVENPDDEDVDQEPEERPDAVGSVENRFEVNEQLNELMEAVEDEAVAEEEHLEDREEPPVPLVDQVEDTVEGSLLDVSPAADDHFPPGNDFSDMVDDEDEFVMRRQTILDDSDGAIVDFDDSTLGDKGDDQMDEELVDEEIESDLDDEEMEEEESDEDDEKEENDGNESEEKDEENGDDEEDEDDNIGKKDVQKRRKSATSFSRLFVCPVKNCSYSYYTFQQLKEHVKIHSNKENLFCDVCKKDFPSKNAAMAHIQRRMRKECCACGKRYTSPQGILEHLRVHTGEKPYVCGYCKKRYSHRINLKRHEMMHTGEKPFKCIHCDSRFIQKQGCIDHERTHTGERPYSCKKCSRSYFSAGALRSHNVRNHKLEKKP